MVKKFSKVKSETKTSFMFPSLHNDVAKAVSHSLPSIRFCRNNSDGTADNIYNTHVMGRFGCRNETCPTNGWSSKKVAIMIRGYAEDGYNAVVFNQRCKGCNGLGTLVLDEQSYVDRVAYRIQKWAGIPLERQHHAPKGGTPHETEFCEGCKRGVCRQKNG